MDLEKNLDLCIFKTVKNDFYKVCKNCEGYNYNCESYQTLKDKEFKRKDIYKSVHILDDSD